MFTAEETELWTMYIVYRIETANDSDACTACRL